MAVHSRFPSQVTVLANNSPCTPTSCLLVKFPPVRVRAFLQLPQKFALHGAPPGPDGMRPAGRRSSRSFLTRRDDAEEHVVPVTERVGPTTDSKSRPTAAALPVPSRGQSPVFTISPFRLAMWLSLSPVTRIAGQPSAANPSVGETPGGFTPCAKCLATRKNRPIGFHSIECRNARRRQKRRGDMFRHPLCGKRRQRLRRALWRRRRLPPHACRAGAGTDLAGTDRAELISPAGSGGRIA